MRFLNFFTNMVSSLFFLLRPELMTGCYVKKSWRFVVNGFLVLGPRYICVVSLVGDIYGVVSLVGDIYVLCRW